MNETDRRMAEDLRRWTPGLDLPGRVSLLSSCINYWYGPPKHEGRATSLQLPAFVPQPLRCLYGSISTLNEDAFPPDCSGWMDGSPIVIFDWLKHPSELTADSSGIIEFLNENQGIYQCGTLAEDDPPVFVREGEDEDWARHSDRLSDFLLVTIFFELTGQSPLAAHGSFPADNVRAFTKDLVRVDTGHVPWMGDTPVSIYHGGGFVVFAATNSDGTVYLQAAAKTPRVLVCLQELGEWEHWYCDP